jgi:hypothetical protein
MPINLLVGNIKPFSVQGKRFPQEQQGKAIVKQWRQRYWSHFNRQFLNVQHSPVPYGVA